MTHSNKLRQPMAVGLSAAMLIAFAAPVLGENVNIPEGGAVTPGSVFVINFQVQAGCDGLPMDTLEVTIPEAVDNPLPEDVPGWTVESETAPASDGTSRVSLVRWSGGLLEDGAFAEFGLRAGFPDEPGSTIEFPVVQRCGDEMLASVGSSPSQPGQPGHSPLPCSNWRPSVADWSPEETGVTSIPVRTPDETKRVTEGLIACLDPAEDLLIS